MDPSFVDPEQYSTTNPNQPHSNTFKDNQIPGIY